MANNSNSGGALHGSARRSIGSGTADTEPELAMKPPRLPLSGHLVLLTVFLVPLDGVGMIGGATMSRLALAGALAASTFPVLAKGRIPRPNPLELALLASLVWAVVSLIWAPEWAQATRTLVAFSQAILLFLLVSYGARFSNRWWVLLAGSFAAGGTVAAALLIRRGSSSDLYFDRYTLEGVDPNSLGLVVVVTIGLAVSIYGAIRKTMRVWIVAAVGICSVALFYTGSRGAAAAAFVGLVAALGLAARRGGWRLLGLAIVGMTITAGALAVAPEQALNRLGGAESQAFRPAESTPGRFELWAAAVNSWAEKPILGHGMGQSGIAVSDRVDLTIEPHSSFLALLADLGIGAIPALVVIALLTWRQLAARHHGLGLFPVAAALLVGAAALNWQYRKEFWCVLAILAVRQREVARS